MNPTIEPWVIGLIVFGLLVFMGILVAFSLTLTLRSRTELEEIKSRSVRGAPLWTKTTTTTKIRIDAIAPKLKNGVHTCHDSRCRYNVKHKCHDLSCKERKT